MLLQINHPARDGQKTKLKAKAAAAAVTLTMWSNVGFAENDYIVVGEVGSESAQIVRITALTNDDQVTVTPAIKFAQTIDAPIARIAYNQIKVYKSSTETGTYALLVTVEIGIDELKTFYSHTTGLSTDYYKFSYYHDQGALETALSGAISSAGPLFYSLQSITDRVLSILPDKSTRDNYRPYVAEWINGFYEEQRNLILQGDDQYFLQSLLAQPLIADQQEYSLPTNCTYIERLDFSYDSTNYEKATPERLNSAEPSGTDERQIKTGGIYSQEDPFYYLSANKFGARPKPIVDGLYSVWYYKLFTPLTNPGDVLERPFQSYSKMFVEYGRSKVYARIGDKESERMCRDEAISQSAKMMVEVAGQQKERPGALDIFTDVSVL